MLCWLCAGGMLAQQEPARQPVSEMERAIEEFKTQMRHLDLPEESAAKKAQKAAPRREWHGRLYEYFRNDFLDAVPHEVAQRGGNQSVLRRNQFGFSVSGPVVVPGVWPRGSGTFFTLTYEGVRESIARASLLTVPILPERTGDYSTVVDQAGNILPVFDPATTRPNSGYDPSRPITRDNLQYARAPFPLNRIPASLLDPVAQKALGFYPAPNASAGPFLRNNYFVNSPETNTPDGTIVRLDQAWRERHRFSVELALSNGFSAPPRIFPTAADSGPPDKRFESRRVVFEHVFTRSPNTVNTASFKVTRDVVRSGEAEDLRGYADLIGLGGVSRPFFPVFSFAPYVSMGRPFPSNTNASNIYTWTDAISIRRGKHTLKLSGEYTARQLNVVNPQYPSGLLRFSSGLTSLPGVVNTGHAFASFLLGLADYAETSIVPSPSYFRRNDLLATVTEHFEIRKGLALNIGATLRRESPRVEKYDRQSTVDLEAINPANGRKGALVAASRNGAGRAFRPVIVALNPSASLTWNPFGDSKTVIRPRYARGSGPPPIPISQWGTQGFNAYPAYISPNVQLEPAVLLSKGLPPPARPMPDLRPEAANDTYADLIDNTGRAPIWQDIHLDLERQLPASMVVSSTLTYSDGKNLLVDVLAADPNAIPLENLRYRDLLNNELFNRSLRPYPQYKGFVLSNSYPRGRNKNAGVSLRVEKRSSKGLHWAASYNFGKQMDDYSGPYGKQDFHRRENEWSVSATNIRHNLQFTYVYELPFGANKPFLNFPGWRRRLASGWSLSGTGSIQGGTPVALRAQFNNTGGVVQALRVNVVPGVGAHVTAPGPFGWFNPAAFDQPPDFTIGNLSRTHPALRNPGEQNYDLSLTRRIAFASERTVEFSAAGFNSINHANWNAPDNVIGPRRAPNVNAGKIIGSRGGRVIQLGLRFNF